MRLFMRNGMAPGSLAEGRNRPRQRFSKPSQGASSPLSKALPKPAVPLLGTARKRLQIAGLNGSPGKIRTCDQPVNSRLLYR